MKGIITENLQLEYISKKQVVMGRLYIGEDVQIRLMDIPKDQHEYAKAHIGEEVQFIIWEGGRGEQTPPVPWIQHKQPKEIIYTEKEVEELIYKLFFSKIYVDETPDWEQEDMNKWFEENKKK